MMDKKKLTAKILATGIMGTRGGVRLAIGEYFLPNQEGLDWQIVGARRQFITALGQLVPPFFERLRDQVYPLFLRLSEGVDEDHPYWARGWKLETWQEHSDQGNQLTPALMDWAREFHVEGEAWILEGALQTMSNWRQAPMQASGGELDILGFQQYVAVPGLAPSMESPFQFEDLAWDPMFCSCADWRKHMRERFETALDAHEREMRRQAEAQGAILLAPRFRPEHFQWLALYQCGGLSLDLIRRRFKNVADNTTISKGIHHAAQLAALAVRAKSSKLKKP